MISLKPPISIALLLMSSRRSPFVSANLLYMR